MNLSNNCRERTTSLGSSNTNRGSYPSKQRKFGPAPLASFEDLPTDEAASTASSGSENEDRRTLVGDPISIVISDESTPVPTPVPPIAITEYSAMQPPIEDPVERCALLSSKQQSNSVHAGHTPPRKSSWIDIFTLRRPSSGTPTSSASLTPKSGENRKLSLFNFKFFDKGDTSPKAEECEMQRLSVQNEPITMTNRHERMNGNTNDSLAPNMENKVIDIGCPIDYDNIEPLIVSVIEKRPVDYQGSNDSIGSCPSSCSSIICCDKQPIENQNHRYPVNPSVVSASTGSSSLSSRSSSSSSSSSCIECSEKYNVSPNSMSVNINGVCPNCDIHPAPVDVSFYCSETDCCENADAEDNEEDDSPAVVRAADTASLTELKSLIKHDDLEVNRVLQMALPKLTLSNSTSSFGADSKNMLSPVWRHNNGETTKTSPVERPRSITSNINIGSFEAFVAEAAAAQECLPSTTDCDRLTIKLPGVHLSPRGRFARKSNPHIWAEFCERGLKSPQARQRANSCFPQLNQIDCSKPGGETLCSPDNLTPLTPITPITPICDGKADYSDESESDRHFGDRFWNTLTDSKYANYAEDSFSMTSSSLTTSSSDSTNLNRTPPSSIEATQELPTCAEDRPLVSTGCACTMLNMTATEDECSTTQLTTTEFSRTSESVSASSSCSDSFASQSGALLESKSLISDF